MTIKDTAHNIILLSQGLASFHSLSLTTLKEKGSTESFPDMPQMIYQFHYTNCDCCLCFQYVCFFFFCFVLFCFDVPSIGQRKKNPSHENLHSFLLYFLINHSLKPMTHTFVITLPFIYRPLSYSTTSDKRAIILLEQQRLLSYHFCFVP